jgi:hypothetical protein
MTHNELISSLVRSVREIGAAATLDQLRADRPQFDRGNYHDTRAVYFVWAVDHLVGAGLSDIGVLWHPLVDDRSPLVWWHPGVLESAVAHERFLAPTLVAEGELRPLEPRLLVAA